ncbi:FAD binding domain-containing protein [Streptomyces sp. NPDC054796]
MSGGRIGIIGGSIAGCAMGTALRRAGYDTEIYERSTGELRDRGAGIAIPGPLADSMADNDYVDAGFPAVTTRERLWIVRDGMSEKGRIVWRQPSHGVATNWSVLWRNLRDRVPEGRYHPGRHTTAVRTLPDGVELTFADGARRTFDAVVGADGYRSIVRQSLYPDTVAHHPEYVAWRGTVTMAAGAARELAGLMTDAWATVCFPGGHAVFYVIPCADASAQGASGAWDRRLNWVIYTRGAECGLVRPPVSHHAGVKERYARRFHRLMGRLLPPLWARAVASVGKGQLSLQPVCDLAVPSYAGGRRLLAGDAGCVSRPHASSGVTRAVEDARAAGAVLGGGGSLEEGLAEYGAVRAAEGERCVDLGRRLGHHQVEHTPCWDSMDAAGMDAWSREILADRTHYLYGNVR